jgi:hypothetical protein
MFEKMNEKDKNTIKKGGIAAVVVVVLVVAVQVYGNWNKEKAEYNSIENQLRILNVPESARKKTLEAVPVFLMPKDEQNQKTLFRNSLDQLFEQLGIYTDPWQEVTTTKTPIMTGAGYGALRLKASGSCRFVQIFNLLASLKQNPYHVGIEELHIECDPQNPQQADFSIQVSTITLTQSKRGK